MRDWRSPQSTMLTFVNLEERVPSDHLIHVSHFVRCVNYSGRSDSQSRCLNENVTEAELLSHVDATKIRSLPHDGVWIVPRVPPCSSLSILNKL